MLVIPPKVLRSLPNGRLERFDVGVKTKPNYKTKRFDESRVRTIIWRWTDERGMERLSEFELSTGEYLGDSLK
jgi:hypothetical protein